MAATTASVIAVSDAPDTPSTTADLVGNAVADAERDDAPMVDLDAIERDLAAVERALERLSEGTYWTDEATGAPIPEHVLAADPTARRA